MNKKLIYTAILVVISCGNLSVHAGFPTPRYGTPRTFIAKNHNEHLQYRRRNQYRFLPFSSYWPWAKKWNRPFISTTPVEHTEKLEQVVTSTQRDVKKAFGTITQSGTRTETPGHPIIAFILMILFVLLSMAGYYLITKNRRKRDGIEF